ncbi:MAG TPA: NADPH-dependent FMN reductase, partial [Thermomicrobiales bacterium]|nr:NADPH-dependent FMN reductase [Thermomicrobiales bacterium]
AHRSVDSMRDTPTLRASIMTIPSATFVSTGKPRILGIGGSMNAVSRNRVVTRHLLDLAEDAGAETVFADVRELALPIYIEDTPYDEQPAALHWLIAQIQAADGFIIDSPNYHGTISGAVKNALDAVHILHGADRSYFDNRPVALACYGGPSSQNVINALYHCVRGMRGLTVPTVVHVGSNQIEMAGDTGRISDERTLVRAQAMIGEVLDLIDLRRARDLAAAAD